MWGTGAVELSEVINDKMKFVGTGTAHPGCMNDRANNGRLTSGQQAPVGSYVSGQRGELKQQQAALVFSFTRLSGEFLPQ